MRAEFIVNITVDVLDSYRVVKREDNGIFYCYVLRVDDINAVDIVSLLIEDFDTVYIDVKAVKNINAANRRVVKKPVSENSYIFCILGKNATENEGVAFNVNTVAQDELTRKVNAGIKIICDRGGRWGLSVLN